MTHSAWINVATFLLVQMATIALRLAAVSAGLDARKIQNGQWRIRETLARMDERMKHLAEGV